MQLRWAPVSIRHLREWNVSSGVQAFVDHKKCLIERGPTSSVKKEPFPKVNGTISEGTMAAIGRVMSFSSEGGITARLVLKAAMGCPHFASFTRSTVIGWYTVASRGKWLQGNIWSVKSWWQTRQPLLVWNRSRSTSISLGGKRYPGGISIFEHRRVDNLGMVEVEG